MNQALLFASLLALVGCFVSPLLVFYGSIDDQTFKSAFAACSLGWFVFSAVRIYRPKPEEQ
jgi:phosphoglycerol transferase MdoB-like AlkP superfamily enzyme